MARRKGFSHEGSVRILFARYYKLARRRALAWELSLEEFERMTSAECHYCGIPPRQILRAYHYNGIDRLNNKRGYERDNCVSACGFCNMAKRGNTVQKFYEWIERLVKKHGQGTVQGEQEAPAERGKEVEKPATS